MDLVVVGAINVDLVVSASRLPGPGETVVGPEVERHGGGKGANASVAAARSGARVRLIGAVGSDDTGSAALAELSADGVDVDLVESLDDIATGVALIVVDPAGENQIAVGAGANGALSAAHVSDALSATLSQTGCVLVSTEIPDEAILVAVRTAVVAGVRCVLNPAPVVPAVSDLLALGPILTPNRTELRDLTGESDPAACARSLQERTGAPVVVTLGGDGALVLDVGREPLLLPAHPATVRDTTGAGDTFNGVRAARLADGDDLDAAVRRAMVAASISVGSVGARSGMPDATTIDAALRE
ncbi:ribokinase [soil metagenome]